MREGPPDTTGLAFFMKLGMRKGLLMGLVTVSLLVGHPEVIIIAGDYTYSVFSVCCPSSCVIELLPPALTLLLFEEFY